MFTFGFARAEAGVISNQRNASGSRLWTEPPPTGSRLRDVEAEIAWMQGEREAQANAGPNGGDGDADGEGAGPGRARPEPQQGYQEVEDRGRLAACGRGCGLTLKHKSALSDKC